MTSQAGTASTINSEDWSCVFDDAMEVLVVEDDEADAFLIRKALRRNPHIARISHAHDGLEALDWLDKKLINPDVAIIDLHMPKKNGHSLLIELRCRPEWDFPTIVLTSSKAREDATRSRLRGANYFMTKPDTVDELDSMLTHAMRGM